MKNFFFATCALLVLPALLGCEKKPAMFGAKSPKTATHAVQDSAQANPDAVRGSDASVETNGLHVSEAIARACGLPKVEVSPSFDFDSASIGNDDRLVLSALAKCLSEGALRGRALALTGRADPRGEDEYNMTLGASRADSVRRYLHDLGVQAERLRATSRGELDALGKDETTWAIDRRVDIDLAN